MNSAGPAWSAARYAANARFVSDRGAAAPTARIAEGGAEVLGVDASPDRAAAARRRGVDALVGRGEALEAGAGFDAVFSNATAHWTTDPDAAIAGVARVLQPGGWFVAEFGGHGDVAALTAPALRDRSGAWTADYVRLRFRAVLGGAA